MSSNYSTIQQHEPLRVPAGWGAQEKRLIAQLEEILDDLYRRFGRLKMTDLGVALRKRIIEAEDEIQLRVTSQEFEDGMAEKLDADDPSVGVSNSAITINTEGIFMVAGTISLSASSELLMQSGGIVNIDGASGTVNLGTGSLVRATQGTFDSLLIGGELYRKIVVSETQPSGHEIFWARPQSSTLGSVSAAFDTPATLNEQGSNWLFSGSIYGSPSSHHVHTISRPSFAPTISAATVDYTLAYPILAREEIDDNVTYLTAKVTRGSDTVNFNGVLFHIMPYSGMTLTLTASNSSVNLFSSAHAGESIVVETWMVNNTHLIYTQSQSQVTLTGTANGVAAVAQCELFYIQ